METMIKCWFCKEEIPDTTEICQWCGRRQRKTPPLNTQEIHTEDKRQDVSVPPWDWFTPAPKDNGSQLLQNLRESLPSIFAAIAKPGRDPVFVLADVVETRWKGLIYLLFKYGKVYYSPETICELSPQFETISGEPLYKAPVIQGRQLKVGIYAVERESLFSELCAIRGVPPPLIKQVKQESPKDMFTVAYFCGLSLGVRYVSPDARKDESPPVDSFPKGEMDTPKWKIILDRLVMKVIDSFQVAPAVTTRVVCVYSTQVMFDLAYVLVGLFREAGAQIYGFTGQKSFHFADELEKAKVAIRAAIQTNPALEVGTSYLGYSTSAYSEALKTGNYAMEKKRSVVSEVKLAGRMPEEVVILPIFGVDANTKGFQMEKTLELMQTVGDRDWQSGLPTIIVIITDGNRAFAEKVWTLPMARQHVLLFGY